jgi:hypothetical protein
MNYSSIPWSLVVFFLTYTGAFVGFQFKLHYDNKRNKEAIDELKKENADLKRELKEVRETLLLVKHSVDLLVLGQLKTGNRNREAA